jgi:protein-L-isoaspartate(D-aspartate) O-methyltransferase
MSMRMKFLVGLMMASMAGDAGGSGTPAQAEESQMDWSSLHRQMLDAVNADVARNHQVLGRDHLSAAVAQAMAAVPRHEFVPKELQANAYANRPLPIGHGQTISQPTIVALMTDLLGLKPDAKVLEVGTGSGYQAAVLCEVVAEGTVYTVEIVPDLARDARKRLKRLQYDNVRVHTGDGYLGRPAEGPFDGIMVTAASDEIPPPLIEQIAPGGRLVMPVGGEDGTQWLTVLAKDSQGKISRRVVLPVRFVPLTGDNIK